MIASFPQRLSRWFSSSIGGLTLLRIASLCLVMLSVSNGLTRLIYHLPRGLGWTALMAILFGWLLARSRLSGWRSGLLAAATGALWLLLTVGNLGPSLKAILDAYLAMLGDSLRSRALPDFAPLFKAVSDLFQATETIFSRFSLWLRTLGSNTIITDPLVISLRWGMGIWAASAWAAWWIRRRGSPEIAILPAGILLTSVVFFTGSKSGIFWLVLMAGGWLATRALESYSAARRRWLEQHIDRADIEPPWAVTVLIIVMIAMLVGGIVPGISIQKIINTLQEMFPAQEASGGAAGAPGEGSAGGGGVWSNTHTISGGQRLPADIVMYVTVEGYSPPPPPEVQQYANAPQADVRYYWRSTTYSDYNGYVWSNYNFPEQAYEANAPLYPDVEGLLLNHKLVRQQVERAQPLHGLLFFTGDLLNVNQPYTIIWRTSGEPVEARTEADVYTAESRIPYVTVAQLRASGKDYPPAIRDRYLALPKKVPGRVYNLALELTLNLDNPYDRATAIEDYLRQIPYSLDVPAPPANREVADYFLFDLKKGYCDYYATTMVVLARAAGLPARLVTGFVSGSYDYSTGRFVVREYNAHAWVEVYFSGIGWVEFEPTGSEPRLPRPGGLQGNDSTAYQPNLPETEQKTEPLPVEWLALRRPIKTLAILLGILLFLVLLPKDGLLYLYPSNEVVKIIYRRLYRQGRLWGIKPDAARTPREFSASFAAHLKRLGEDKHLAPVIAAVLDDLNRLTLLYSRLLFSPQPLSSIERRQAVRAWISLQRGLRKMNR